MVYCNCGIVPRNIADDLLHAHAKLSQRNFLWAVDCFLRIRPEQIFSIPGANGDKIGVGCTVIIFCQTVLFSLWQFHMYHLSGIVQKHCRKNYYPFQGRIYSPPAKASGAVLAANGRPYIPKVEETLDKTRNSPVAAVPAEPTLTSSTHPCSAASAWGRSPAARPAYPGSARSWRNRTDGRSCSWAPPAPDRGRCC